MRLEWSRRIDPRPVEGCWAEGEAARKLSQKLKAGSGLRAVTGQQLLVVLGTEVPWVDGLIYLGRRDLLYLPTLWEPNLPYDWLVARLRALGHPPWALLPPAQDCPRRAARALGLSAAAALV